MDSKKVAFLNEHVGDYPNVDVLEGDCNQILLEQVFPNVRFEDYRRGLCVLDPYGIHIDWKVIATAARMKSIEIFLNFSIMDINMNFAKRDLARVSSKQADRFDRMWGDDSWKEFLYTKSPDLFGSETAMKCRQAHIVLPNAFASRLKKEAGFKYVADPIAFFAESGKRLYYLFFASQNETGYTIANYIFEHFGQDSRI